MIIRQLKLSNFGIYEDAPTFTFTPEPSNGFSRPIVLVRGQNGAGKTTLIEAIRLCLHGSLILGSRVGRAEYEAYLAKRIHNSARSETLPQSAQIVLWLDYVNAGQKLAYKIERSWEIVDQKVKETIEIWEDGQTLDELQTREQKDSFLRELVPPGIADLFFFDGEKLDALVESAAANDVLANTVKTLLGLHLVERLQKDLDIYLSRHRSNNGSRPLQQQLDDYLHQIATLERQQTSLKQQQARNIEIVEEKQRLIAEQEQCIASAGQWFSERLEQLHEDQRHLETEIEVQRRHAQELAAGLLPFSIAPQMCSAIAERLRLEAKHKQSVAAQQLLEEQLEQVSAQLTSFRFWEEVGIVADEESQRRATARITDLMKSPVQRSALSETEVIHRVSEQEHHTLLNWIADATSHTPQEFIRTINQLNALEAQLAQVTQQMQQVPPDETLKPLVEALHLYNQELGKALREDGIFTEQLARLAYQLEQLDYQRERLRQQIAEHDKANTRIQLTNKTQTVLTQYVQALSERKTKMLADSLVARFNALCRKEDLVDNVHIDPVTFEITLHRQKQRFDLQQLSAGERQLLAMAIMWALREVSGVPIPVVIDTPLGRLDADHRLRVVRHYFPRVSHQVILLATDAEVDDQILTDLVPAISDTYHLDYDPQQGKTIVCRISPQGASASKKLHADAISMNEDQAIKPVHQVQSFLVH